MKEIKTCEDYVLAELEEKKAQIQKLNEVCKEYLEVMKNVDRCFDVLKKFLTIRKASGGINRYRVQRDPQGLCRQELHSQCISLAVCCK